MKRIEDQPDAASTVGASGKRYWRSVGEFEDTPAFREWAEREFPAGLAELEGQDEADVSRRSFFRLMGAATSLAGFGLASCRRPVQPVLPYARHVEWVVPGRPTFYATAMPRPGGCTPVVATTHEGRPTHLQGNPLHPLSRGGLDSFGSASVLDLYDPDRSRSVLHGGVASGFEEARAALEALRVRMDGVEGDGLALLVGESTSPTRARLVAELAQRWPKLGVYLHEPAFHAAERTVVEAIYGAGARLRVDLSKATCVFSLDRDFLGLDRLDDLAISDFARGRKPEEVGGEINRLYCVENRYTLTGGQADHRHPLAASLVPAAAAVLARALGVEGASGLDGAIEKLEPEFVRWLEIAADDLRHQAERSIVLVGSGYSEATQALVFGINSKLGSLGSTLEVLQGDPVYGGIPVWGINRLGVDIRTEKVKELVVLTDCDPAYDAPADLGWADLVARLDMVFHLGHRRNATAHSATWHVPSAHYLECWDDARSADGTYSIIQPMIQPLYGGLSVNDVLVALLRGGGEAEPSEAVDPLRLSYLAVRETFAGIVPGAIEEAWELALRDGFLAGSAYPVVGSALGGGGLQTLLSGWDSGKIEVPSEVAMELVFQPSASVWDGRYVNNGWLQEAPDPITKLTWDNAAWVSPRTFRQVLKLKESKDQADPRHTISIELSGRRVEIPVIECPGHADHSITLTLGYYGKDWSHAAGRVGNGAGFDVYRIRPAAFGLIAPPSAGAKVTVGESTYLLATTAEHYSMKGRALAREGTLEDWEQGKELPEGKKSYFQSQGEDSHVPPNISLYHGQMGVRSESNPQGFDYERKHQWGMVIDLGACLGCHACLVACQSENNIPIVGKEQVIRGREMHWIRLDRYFATSDTVTSEPSLVELSNPEMITQPVGCLQCESAPCETVCPVNATVHTEEGLNAMAYNRCIGTRYCANNCPYKARRFNFFDYNKRPIDELYRGPLSTPEKTGVPQAMQLQKNPNVTVRMRGVMEKCTYCVQRLEEAKIQQKRLVKGAPDTRLPADTVKVACQQACPAEAISFGDLAHPDSTVVRLKASQRNYDLLNYIGTRPRTSYLARVKNPNPAMTEAFLWEKKRVGRATAGGH
jgi:MoCo/4Fe-4S cofactor protein with predicted Tat translocation signal